MIGWLVAGAGEVPEHDAWLLPVERQTLAGLRVPKRREEWRLGRWAAKHAVGLVLAVDAERVEVRAGADGAPGAWLAGAPLPLSVSISHSSHRAACTVASPAAEIGCDLELIEPRAPVFVADWFTADEARLVAEAAPSARDQLVTVIWSAKESALKALRCGLRRDTRSVVVSARQGRDGEWSSLGVRDHEGGRDLEAWWRVVDDLVLTVAAPSPARPPVQLERHPSRAAGGSRR